MILLLDKVFRKVKPMPLNHQKLLKKQKQLLQKKTTKVSKKAILTEYQLPSDFYTDYTMNEMETTAESYSVSFFIRGNL